MQPVRWPHVTYTERIVNALLRTAFQLIARMDTDGLRRLPRRGPGILMTNHTSNLEGPAYYVFMAPRPTTALGKRELWDRWFTRFLMNLWGVIPVSRGQVDRAALRSAYRALDRGAFLGIAPEGTRSSSGRLTRGLPGIALIATARPVPVYPIAQCGLKEIGRNLGKIRRTSVSFRLGRPFRVAVPRRERLSSSMLRAITDEMMYEIARVLPPKLRGAYADIPSGQPHYLEFIDQTP